MPFVRNTNELFCSLDSVALCVDEGVIFLAICSSHFMVNTCGNSRCVPTLVYLKQTSIRRCYSLMFVKVTFVVSSSKNIFITV